MTNSPTFTLTNRIDITGYFILVAGMTCSGSNNFRLAGNLTTGGVTIAGNGIYINGNCTLQDDLTVTSNGARGIEHNSGVLNTNGKTVNITNAPFDETSATARTLTLGASTITCTAWVYSGSNLTLNANTSTIKVTGTGVFTGGGLTYNNVELNGTAHTISGSNTFNTLTLKAATTQTITFTDGTTQTATVFAITGSSGKVKTLTGTSTAGWAIAMASGGLVSVSYCTLDYSTATGGTWFAFTTNGNTDSGNNFGWLFNEEVNPLASYRRIMQAKRGQQADWRESYNGNLFPPPPPGAVLYLPGHPGTGSTITDFSGSGNDGTFGAGAAAPSWAKLPSGLVYLSFDGGDYVLVTDAASFNFTTALSGLCWVSITDITGGEQTFISKYIAGGDNREWAFSKAGATGKIDIKYGNPTNGAFFGRETSTNAVLANNTFALVGFTFAPGVTVLYHNGEPIAETGDTPTSLYNGPADVRIGDQNGISFLVGTNSIIRLFNVTLTGGQMQGVWQRERHLFGV